MHINNKDILFNKVKFPLQNYKLDRYEPNSVFMEAWFVCLAGNWGIRLLNFSRGIIFNVRLFIAVFFFFFFF